MPMNLNGGYIAPPTTGSATPTSPSPGPDYTWDSTKMKWVPKSQAPPPKPIANERSYLQEAPHPGMTWNTAGYWEAPAGKVWSPASNQWVDPADKWKSSPQAPPPPPPGETSKPIKSGESWGLGAGQYENWWSGTGKDAWAQPTQSEQYWNGNQGYFNAPHSENYGKQQGYADSLTQPGALDAAFNDTIKPGLSGPGSMEQWYAQHGGDMNTPGAFENWAKDNGQFFATPGAQESYYGQNNGAFTTPGRFENDANSLIYGLGNTSGGAYDFSLRFPGLATQARNQVAGDFSSIKNSEDFFNRNRGQLERGGYTERMADAYKPKMGYSEQLYTGSGGAGLDALMNRLLDTGGRRLDEAAAAKGGFNSGAALRSREELTKDVISDRINKQIALASQAEGERQAEQGYGLNLMGGADTSLRGRLATGGALGQQADQSAIARAKAKADFELALLQQQGSAAQAGGSEQLGRIMDQAGLSRGAQDEALARLQAGGNMSQDAQANALARMAAGGNVAKGSQDEALARFASGEGAAGAAQGAANTRLISLGNAANALDTTNRENTTAASGILAGEDARDLARKTAGSGVASGVDSAINARLIGAGNAAQTAQLDTEGRVQQNFNMGATMADKQSGLVERITDAAQREHVQNAEQQIQAMLLSGQLDANAAMQQLQQIYSTAGLAISAADAAAEVKKLQGGAGAATTSSPAPTSTGSSPSVHYA